jgi:peroxiredoxin
VADKAGDLSKPETRNLMAGTQPKIRFSKVMEIFLWLVALGVLAENIFLFLQNRRLSEALAPQITAGTRLQMLSGVAFDGRLEPVTLPAAGSKLLIITFSPGCPACQANQEGWMRLASALEQRGVRVLWLSRDPIEITRDYCTKHGIRLSDTLADPPYRTFAQLGLARVPNTVLVGAEGRVEKDVWIRQAGTRCLHILANGRRRLLLSEVSLAPTQPAAGRSCRKSPPRAVSKTKITRKKEKKKC